MRNKPRPPNAINICFSPRDTYNGNANEWHNILEVDFPMNVVRVDFARARVADSAQSEAFINQIQALAQCSAWSDTGEKISLRYSPKTIENITRTLLGRGPNLRDAVLQLVHLLHICGAAAPSGRALDVAFTLSGPMRADNVKNGLAAALADPSLPVQIKDNGIEILYRSAGSYRLASLRLPLLMALLEFVLGLELQGEEHQARERAFEQAQGCKNDRKEIVSAANALGAVLNRALDQILRNRYRWERLSAIMDFLDTRANSNDADAAFWTIDDEAVLACWEDAQTSESSDLDARLYSNVYQGFVELFLALSDGDAWQSINESGVAWDADEGIDRYMTETTRWDPNKDDVEHLQMASIDLPSMGDDALAALKTPPLDSVKFLNESEHGLLGLVNGAWRQAPELPLSVMRATVMGLAQNRITQALRGNQIPSLDVIEGDMVSYERQLEKWQKVGAHLEKVRLAAALVVSRHEGLPMPSADVQARATQAFRSLRRSGFADALTSEEKGEIFGDAIASLAKLSALLEKLLDALPANLPTVFCQDAERFSAIFRKVYTQ